MSDREAVRVVMRCRPFSEKEKVANYSSVVSINIAAAMVSIFDPKTSTPPVADKPAQGEPPKTFTFDSVFDCNATQIDVYNKTARPIVDSVLNGYNGTVFAYGQTGTGKTFSMEGIRDVPELRGIIPNSFDHIFSHIKLAPEGVKFLVRASYLEIYNEEIHDLLNNNAKLDIKERADIGVYVKDLRSFVIKDLEEMDKLMTFGNKNRSVGSTLMNATSSRSHSIFTVTVEVSEIGADGEEHIKAGKLNLVDLAGSERQTKTGATGDRLKEATKINLSLSALGNVISALVDGKSSHIPYRDSKLTRLLQDSLGGNARTLMLATMSPASYNYDESLSSLRYANRAKNIKNKPKINEDPKDAMLREFQEEIKKLRAQLESESTGERSVIEREEVVEEVEEVEEIVDDEEDAVEGAKPKGPKGPKSTKKKKSKMSISDTNENSLTGAPDSKLANGTISAPDIARMQELVEEEKRHIMASKDMEESERNKLVEDLEKRAVELEKERLQKSEVAAKLSQLEAKLLVGGVNVLDKEGEQRMELARKVAEIEEKQRQERELERQLMESEETNLQIEEEYASLQEEAAAKTKKLKKLWTLMMNAKSEVKDLQQEHQRERENLLETVRAVTRELKLKLFVVSQFIPEEYIEVLEGAAVYDDSAEKWRIAQVAHAGNNIQGKRSLVSGQLLGKDTITQKGFNRDQEDFTKNNEIEEDDFTPMCVFRDIFLTYDLPSVNIKKKAPEVKMRKEKTNSAAITKKNVRPSSAASKRPQSAKSSNFNNSLSSNGSINLSEKNLDKKAPKARGLVSKTKRYA